MNRPQKCINIHFRGRERIIYPCHLRHPRLKIELVWNLKPSSVKTFAFPLSKNRKTSSPALPHLKDEQTLALRWITSSYRLKFNGLHSIQNFCVFSSERKVACIYAILARSVLHKYTVGVYKYTFHSLSVTSSPARVHTLCRASAQPIVECLKKLSRPCAHGQWHLCTRTSRFHPPALRTLHIYTKKQLSQSILLGWNREEKKCGNYYQRV